MSKRRICAKLSEASAEVGAGSMIIDDPKSSARDLEGDVQASGNMPSSFTTPAVSHLGISAGSS